MKIFFAETKHDYSSYLFPYQVLLLRDKKDSLSEIYASGFLPFRNKENLFYLARSARSNLKKFSLSSENRRILKKTQHIVSKTINLSDFDYDFHVQRKCKRWAKERGWKISTLSLKYLFSGKFFNSLIMFSDKKNIIGYFVILRKKDFWHAAYPFYHPDYYRLGLGTRMLLESCLLAEKAGADSCYLGTCYGKRGFYKRNMPGFEFFNGLFWSENLEELAYLNSRESNKHLLKDKEYLNNFFSGGEKKIFSNFGMPIKIIKSLSKDDT
jgi:GNAT superfamily N-acetyltransferase